MNEKIEDIRELLNRAARAEHGVGNLCGALSKLLDIVEEQQMQIKQLKEAIYESSN